MNAAENLLKLIAVGDITLFESEPALYLDKSDIVYQTILKLSHNEDFLADIKKIKLTKRLLFSKRFAQLKRKYRLSEGFDIALTQFIHHGSLTSFSLGNEPYVVSKYNTLGEREVFIKIFPETSVKDIQKNWNSINHDKNKYFGYQPKKRVLRKNLERDLEIFRLWKSGMSYKNIAKFINSRYTSNINETEVGKIIKRLDKAS